TFAATVHFVMAAVLFWRKSDDWMEIFLSLQMLSFGATWSNVITSLAQAFPIWYPVGRLLGAFSLCSVLISFYIFPTGQFVPRWTKWLVPFILFMAITQPSSLFSDHPLFLMLLFLALLASGVYALIYRYRRVSNAVQRQQTKWVTWGASIGALSC